MDADDATEAAVGAVRAVDAADAAGAADALTNAVGTAQATRDVVEEKRAVEQVEDQAVEMMIKAEHEVKGLLETEMKKRFHSLVTQEKLDSMVKGMDAAVAKVVEEEADEEISDLRVRALSICLGADRQCLSQWRNAGPQAERRALS